MEKEKRRLSAFFVRSKGEFIGSKRIFAFFWLFFSAFYTVSDCGCGFEKGEQWLAGDKLTQNCSETIKN